MGTGRQKGTAKDSGIDQLSPEHYLRLLVHRKWLVLGVFLAVSAATILVAKRLPDIYTSETVILVDPQKVPEAYVKSTVTGDVRNRLGTLSQQILSATRLQRIIDSLNLYPEEKKKSAREDLIDRMRKDISVSVVSDFGGSQDLQAFRISYSGENSRLVAQVTNELASLFIEENLKAREQQATGTTEFLQNQLQETRQTLEAQEAKLKDFKLKHIGEMPEQQTADLQILGQLQSQLQLEGRRARACGATENHHSVDDDPNGPYGRSRRRRPKSGLNFAPCLKRRHRRDPTHLERRSTATKPGSLRCFPVILMITLMYGSSRSRSRLKRRKPLPPLLPSKPHLWLPSRQNHRRRYQRGHRNPSITSTLCSSHS